MLKLAIMYLADGRIFTKVYSLFFGQYEGTRGVQEKADKVKSKWEGEHPRGNGI